MGTRWKASLPKTRKEIMALKFKAKSKEKIGFPSPPLDGWLMAERDDPTAFRVGGEYNADPG